MSDQSSSTTSVTDTRATDNTATHDTTSTATTSTAATSAATGGRLRMLPPAPAGFDPFTASSRDLARHGLPRRPDPDTEPDLASLWETKAAQYRGFTHLEPSARPGSPLFAPDTSDICGYSLTTDAGPFTSLFITSTVPDLQYDTDPDGINTLHTYAGLGLLDVHVHLSVDSAQSVTCTLMATAVGIVDLPLRPGDLFSATLCLNTNPAATASYFFVNETTAQTMSFSVDTGLPHATFVNAGVSRDGVTRPGQSLARFGAVYFDEIRAYNSNGNRSLTSGQSVNMVDSRGTRLATASALTSYAFKVISG
jgi:hypothetical protein